MTDTTYAARGDAMRAGGSLIEALGRRDFDAFQRCLADSAHLRALVPHGPFELDGAQNITDRFRMWFGGPDEFQLLEATVAEVGSKEYLRWRIRMAAHDPQSRRTAEQHVFTTGTDAIETLDLLCSGFQYEGPGGRWRRPSA